LEERLIPMWINLLVVLSEQRRE